MARRGSRDTIAPNIYQDGSGFSVKVGTREQRFAPGTPMSVLEDTRRRLKGQGPARAGTLKADAIEVLKGVADAKRRKNLTILLSHWTAAHGETSRWALTPLVIRQQLAAWVAAGVAPSTCNKRLSALRTLFNQINTDDEPNPAQKVKKLREPDPEPRAIDYATIVRIFRAMPDRGRPTGEGKGTRPTVNLSKLRLMVMAYTGLPHTQLANLQDGDINWELPALRVTPRRKGKGTTERWIPLTPQAVEVLTQFAAAKAWGSFSRDALRKTWQRACAKVRQEQLANGEAVVLPDRPSKRRDASGVPVRVPAVRPYDLRHSYGTAALLHSQDLAGTQHLMLHSDPRLTLRYAKAAIPQMATAVVASLQLPAPFGATAVPQQGRKKATKGRKTQKSSARRSGTKTS